MIPFGLFGKSKEQGSQSAPQEVKPPTLDQLKSIYKLTDGEVVECEVVFPYESQLRSMVGPGTTGYARTVFERKQALEKELKEQYANDGIEVRIEQQYLGFDPKTNDPVFGKNTALLAVKKSIK